MSTQKLSNIGIAEWRRFLAYIGCVESDGGNDGHEKWWKDGCERPVIYQTHIEPIPEFIIKNNLRTLGITKKVFFDWQKASHKKMK